MNAETLIPFLKELAQVSAQVILPRFGDASVQVDAKADDSPVTIADKEAEARMRALIGKRFPDHGILGEEHGNENLDAEYVWILDPIDGTKSFITGVPLFTTLIGLLHRGEPVLGAIHQPLIEQLCIGDNHNCWLNDKPVRVRKRSVSEATLLISDPYTIGEFQSAQGWERLVDATWLQRSWGDGYGYMQVAGGWADIMCDPVLEPWDLLPVVPVVRGAGAVITDWQGEALCFETGKTTRSSVAAHPDTHAEVIRLLNG